MTRHLDRYAVRPVAAHHRAGEFGYTMYRDEQSEPRVPPAQRVRAT